MTETGSDMDGIAVSDAVSKLKEEIERLRLAVASLTSERDDLKYHICPELEAVYAREIGDYENRIALQRILIGEVKRRIELTRAALNREKAVSASRIEEQVRNEYREFHEKVDEEFRKAERAKTEQREREERSREYERQWQERYGGRGGESAAGSQESKEETGEGENESEEREGQEQNRTGQDGEQEEKKEKVPNIKELYRKIVKRLHPDSNPNFTEREKELFYKAQEAYDKGDIATLQEIYDEIFGDGSVQTKEKELSYEELAALRDRLKERVRSLQEEIRIIKEGFPYKFRQTLSSPELLKNIQGKLKEEITENEETLKRMNEVLKEVTKELEELRKKHAKHAEARS